MKTMITASALLLVSTYASAASWEAAWQNPDLGTGVYDKPTTLSDPMSSSRNVATSLDSFGAGNPDHSRHARSDQFRPDTSRGFASSLDSFSAGNPDHI